MGVGNVLEFEKKVERYSRPPQPKNGVQTEFSKFKPPSEVNVSGDKKVFEILVKNGKNEPRILDVKQFFDEKTNRFILAFGERETSSKVAGYLFDIRKNLSDDTAFGELVDAAEKILASCAYNTNSRIASLEFLKTVAFESKVDWKRDALVKVMSAFGSDSIIASFELFSGLGPKTMENAASQLVVLGYGFQSPDVIREIGDTINTITEKFGWYATAGYRTVIFEIAVNDSLSTEDKDNLVHLFTIKTMAMEKDEAVFDFSQELNGYLNSRESIDNLIAFCHKFSQ